VIKRRAGLTIEGGGYLLAPMRFAPGLGDDFLEFSTAQRTTLRLGTSFFALASSTAKAGAGTGGL